MFSYNMWNVPTPGAMLPPSQVVFYDDFQTYGQNANVDITLYRSTLVGTSAAVASSAAEANGAVIITSGSTAGETGIQPNGGIFAVPGAGSSLYFECRFKVADADIAIGEVFVGLATPTDTAPIGGATNRIGFARQGGDATLFTVVDSTETSTGKDLSDATYVQVAFKLTATQITYYVNLNDGNGPIKVGVVESGIPATGTLLRLGAFVGDSASNAQTLTLDSWLVIQNR